MTSLAHPRSIRRTGLRAPLPAVPADLPLVDLHLVPVAGPVPDRDGPRAGRRTSRPNRAPRSAACRTWSSWRPACWRRPRCSRRRSRRPSRSWAGWSGARPSTRCTRRRSRRATSRSATWPGSIARLTLICYDLHAGHRRCSGRPSRRSIVLAIPAAVLTGMAFATPIAAFSATQKTPEQVRRDLPLRDHAAVPVLGHVLPDQFAAGRAPGAGLADAALPRGGADPRALARDDRSTTRSRR